MAYYLSRARRRDGGVKVSLVPCPYCGNVNVHLGTQRDGDQAVRCGWGVVGCGTLFRQHGTTDRPAAAAAYNEWATKEKERGASGGPAAGSPVRADHTRRRAVRAVLVSRRRAD